MAFGADKSGRYQNQRKKHPPPPPPSRQVYSTIMSASIGNPDLTGFLETEKFDFVVVGGGTSGLVVATRLTEDPGVKVLVLEAGSNRLEDPRIVTPGLAASLYDDPEFDWCFMSTPQVRRSPPMPCTSHEIIETLERTPTWSAKRTNTGWIHCHQSRHGDLPLQVWIRCMGEAWKPRLEMGDHSPVFPQVLHVDQAIEGITG